MKLTATLSILGLGGCSNDRAEVPQQPRAYTVEDHDRLYQAGCDIVQPYFQLHGVEPRRTDTEQAIGELNRGISLLREVIKINPDNWAAYWIIGKAYQALDASDHACDAFARSFAIQKDNPDVAREYMLECLNLGRAEEGLVAAKHAVSRRPNDPGLLANLAMAYVVGDNLNEAIACVDKSLALAPDDEITQHLKSFILEVQAGKRARPKSTRGLKP